MSHLFRWILSIPKTILFNFYILPISQAVKLPVFIDYKTRILELHKGTIQINGIVSFGMIKIGWGNGALGVECNRNSYWIIEKGALLVFNGNAHFARGVSLRANNCGIISFGCNFAANQNFFCASSTNVSFGDNILLGWNVHVRDSDGHNIFDEVGDIINRSKPIFIGSNVWLASYVSILKGVIISDDCIVGFRSVVTKQFLETNSILSGIPAKIVKRNTKWKR